MTALHCGGDGSDTKFNLFNSSRIDAINITEVREHGAYDRELDPMLKKIFTEYRKTHNQGVFDVYTKDILNCRKSGVLTGLPDAYGRGRIIGDYRRVALYGIASRTGRDSISPTVPPISTSTTSWPSPPAMMRSLMALVMCGIT
jgi:hypothetical protein